MTSNSPPRRRRGPSLITIVMILVASAIGSGAIALGYSATQDADANGRLRDAAIAARAQEVKESTDGAIIVHGKSSEALGNPYRWDASAGIIKVGLTVGDCNNVFGSIATPEAPRSAAEVGELVIFVPSKGDGPEARVSISSPHLYRQLLNSGLAHCIVDDERLMPPKYDG